MNAIDFFQSFGVNVYKLTNNGKEGIGSCPFCNDDRHFYFRVQNALYECKKCKECGNAISIIKKINPQLSTSDILKKYNLQGEYNTGQYNKKLPRGEVVCEYDYVDEKGNLVFQVVRLFPKNFRQRKKVGDKWEWKISDLKELVLYRLPDILHAETVYLVEGEKDADNLHKHFSLPATTNAMGSRQWRPEYNRYLKGKNVVIIPDNDGPGQEHSEKIANIILPVARNVKIVHLPMDLNGKNIKDISDYILAGGTKEQLTETIKTTPVFSPDDDEDPDKDNGHTGYTDSDMLPTMPFPFEILPEDFRNACEREANALGVDAEVIITAKLAIISSLVGNTIRISPKSSWSEPVFVWVNIVAESGYGKTHGISYPIKAIEKLQAEEYLRFKNEMKSYNQTMKELAQKSKKNKYLNPVSDEDLPEKPVFNQYYVSDLTIEALADVFESKPRGCLIYNDELSSLILGLGQYKDGVGNDLQHFLELFNAKPWTINRKAGIRHITNTGAALIGGIQPEVLKEVFGQANFFNGLVPRFLPVLTSKQERTFNQTGITDEDKKLWEDIVRYCIEIPEERNKFNNEIIEPKTIILSAEAIGKFQYFYNDFNQKLRYLTPNARIFIPKMISYCLRLAAILHVLEGFAFRDVPDEICGGLSLSLYQSTMEKAILLTRYFAGQVAKMLELYSVQQDDGISEIHMNIIQAIWNVRGELKNGKILFSNIVREYNKDLHEKQRLHPKSLSSICKNELKLIVRSLGKHKVYLVWEDAKMSKLFALLNGRLKIE